MHQQTSLEDNANQEADSNINILQSNSQLPPDLYKAKATAESPSAGQATGLAIVPLGLTTLAEKSAVSQVLDSSSAANRRVDAFYPDRLPAGADAFNIHDIFLDANIDSLASPLAALQLRRDDDAGGSLVVESYFSFEARTLISMIDSLLHQAEQAYFHKWQRRLERASRNASLQPAQGSHPRPQSFVEGHSMLMAGRPRSSRAAKQARNTSATTQQATWKLDPVSDAQLTVLNFASPANQHSLLSQNLKTLKPKAVALQSALTSQQSCTTKQIELDFQRKTGKHHFHNKAVSFRA